ncbi:hypothetical protein M1307_01380, partial [Patescibacteria group bacterium]|nr:hypothetical protein [Patescibacteria group bacterium]
DKSSLKKLFSERIALKNFIYISLVLNSLNLLLVLIFQKNLPPQVPLFYGATESEEQLTSSLGLLIPSIFSYFLIFFNILISTSLQNRFLQKILTITSFTISLLSAITVVKIIFLVGSF